MVMVVNGRVQVPAWSCSHLSAGRESKRRSMTRDLLAIPHVLLVDFGVPGASI